MTHTDYVDYLTEDHEEASLRSFEKYLLKSATCLKLYCKH